MQYAEAELALGAAENLALMRKMNQNILRTDTCRGSLNVKSKRLHWCDDHLQAPLAQITKHVLSALDPCPSPKNAFFAVDCASNSTRILIPYGPV